MDDERLDTTDRWFAVNLREAREKAGLSQEAVAQRMREAGFPGFRQQTVGRIEAGERGVQVGEGFALARITSTGLDALARPPELIQDAIQIRGATGRLRHLRDEVRQTARLEAEAVERLRDIVDGLREAGKAEVLAEEMKAAESVLAEAATDSNRAGVVCRGADGPSENVL